MKNISSKIILATVLFSVPFASCGKKNKSDDGGDAPPYVSALVMGSDAMNYGIQLLGSTNKTSPSASLSLESFVDSPDSQDATYKDCSNKGSPWDKLINAKMLISNEKFAQTTFYCQMNIKSSPDTLAGTLNQYKAILCSVEKSIGSIEYTSSGKEYKDQTVALTEACGAQGDMLGNSVTATLTAYAMTSGDWQKRVRVQVAAQNIDYNIYFTIKSNLVAFKAIEAWDQSSRIAGGNYNPNISNLATGTRGAVVSIDLESGILRAESVDTYRSRRYRFYIKGTLDGTSGLFTSVTDGQGIVANFDHQTGGLYAEIATGKGNDTDGDKHGNYSYSTSSVAAVRTTSSIQTSTTPCSKIRGCSGLSPISFSAVSGDYDFLMIGAAWDGQSGRRSEVQTWLASAGLLNFLSVDKSVTVF